MNRHRCRGTSMGTAPAGGAGAARGAGAALCLAGLVLVLGSHLGQSLPIVDPGLFVILGVRTCGGGAGYCLLGTDCTLDRDFAADVEGGHCDGLRAAFTPAAHFSCCKYVERSNATLPGEPADTTTTEDPALAATTLQPSDDAENVIETEIRVKPAEGQDADKPADKDAVKDAVKEADKVADEGGVVADKNDDKEIIKITEEDAIKVAVQDGEKDTVKEADVNPGKVSEKDTVVSTPPATTESLRVPLGPASGQTVVAVSEDYKVQGAEDEEEDAEVVAVADVEKEAVLVSPSCRSPSTDVNPCWRSSFQDRQGATLCSGTLVGVDAAVTTAVCANRLLEAGMAAVALRVDGVSMPVRDVAVHPEYRGGADDASDVGLGVETSAVCAGRIASAQAVHMKLSGCEVANLKTSIAAGEQVLAVRAREGAAMVCDGTLHGLASTPSGSYASLGQHARWLSKTLAAPRTSTFRA
ncbi:uncharacterized protein LOC117647389 [Thrips palmi]|uniref:Uncharacterized protein LOC117647389 n=1 Tax=Thrips palmi TaxID=161013 RepID=A0A6P8YXZ8_THRPL|nr:uncharacterized protein LOC117647389 [Thrips palmi]